MILNGSLGESSEKTNREMGQANEASKVALAECDRAEQARKLAEEEAKTKVKKVRKKEVKSS